MVRGRIAATVFVVTASFACSDTPKVGVLCPATGVDRGVGRSVELGVRMALDSAASQGLLPPDFVALHADTASSGRRAVAAYRRVVAVDGAQLVVGGVTAFEAEALVPVVDRERVVCLSPSAPASEAARRSRYFYRLYSLDEVEGFTAARFLRNEADVRTVIVVTDGSMATRGIEAEFRQHFTLLLGGRIVATVRVGEDGWRRRVGDLVHAHDPDGVYVVGHADSILEVLGLVRAIGYRGVRCTNSHVYIADVLGRGGSSLEGVVFPITPVDVESVRDPLLDFAHRFTATYGREPDVYAAQGYDAMRVAIRAFLTARGPDADDLRRVLELEIGPFGGVMGTIDFAGRTDPGRRPVMHTVFGGRVMSVDRLRALQRDAVEGALGLRLGVEPARPDPSPSPSAAGPHV
jgi:branched-chain amino acid transport system substrate-binding protein